MAPKNYQRNQKSLQNASTVGSWQFLPLQATCHCMTIFCSFSTVYFEAVEGATLKSSWMSADEDTAETAARRGSPSGKAACNQLENHIQQRSTSTQQTYEGNSSQ